MKLCLRFLGLVLTAGLWWISNEPVVAQEQVQLVVIAPAQFAGHLSTYLDSRSPEVSGRLEILETLLAGAEGRDDAEKLKRWLYQTWKHQAFDYLLLVGDADRLPVRYMVLDRVTAPAFDYAFYPSDLYFGDLAKADGTFEDWNQSQTGFHADYFGEVRGEKNKTDSINFDRIDYLPEVGVGRWPVSTESELENVIHKSLAYANRWSGSDRDRNPVAAFVYVGGWVDCRAQMRAWKSKLNATWSSEELFFSPESPQSSAHSANHVVQRIKSGCDLVLHAGHGFPEGWDQSLHTGNLSELDNEDRFPIVLSAGCSTAYFATLPPYESYLDGEGVVQPGTNSGQVFERPPPSPANYQTGEFNRTGLGEQLLKHNRHGAVAYFGCNTGSQPCGLTLLEGFVDSFELAESPRLGDSWNHAIRYYHQHQNLEGLQPDAGWYPPSIFFQAMKFMLFGDPSLPMPRSGEAQPKPR